jgi:hypothetical protein
MSTTSLPNPQRLLRLLQAAGEWRRQQQPDLSHQRIGRLLQAVRQSRLEQTLPSWLTAVGGRLREVRREGAFINVWAMAGLGRREVPTAAALAWLLDPHGSHGQGDAALREVVALVSMKRPDWTLQDTDLAEAVVQTEQRPLGSGRDRIDIAVEGPGFILFIEVKIDAGEGVMQLSRYEEAAKAKSALRGQECRALVVFLGPYGPMEKIEGQVHLTWREVADALDRTARHCTGAARHSLSTFAAHVRGF